jgi:hypothetical protein
MTMLEIRSALGVPKITWDQALKEHEGLRITAELAKLRVDSYYQKAARRRVSEGSDALIKFMLERTVEGYRDESRIIVDGTSTLVVKSFAEFKKQQLLAMTEHKQETSSGE